MSRSTPQRDAASAVEPPRASRAGGDGLLGGGDSAACDGQFPPLSPAERETILQRWSGPASDPTLARDELLHEIFEAQADAHPANIAVECSGRRLTYGELEQSANQLARHLRAQGVGCGSFVAILLPRSIDVYVAMLGVLKAGAAYVPLDPEYPADRVSYVLSDCGVHTLITTSALAANHASGECSLLLLDGHATAVLRQSQRRLTRRDTRATREQLCYVIYTSGSTGRPKGVQIEHRSACNLVRAEGRLFSVRADDRVYQGFSVAFDASVEEIWLAFAAGATLVAATAEMVRAGPALPGLLSDAKVTVLSCVPTLLSMMDEDIPTVRLLILGGEACAQDLVRRWCKPGCRMVNTYGPTEATVIATLADCDPSRPVTIGRPLPNYRVYILDSHLQPVPAGIEGELHIGGVGLSRGYVGRPELTAEKFIADPFARGEAAARGEAPARLYKTGDLARFTADGQIEFLGRIDTQVKLRGFRIELSEIEAVLMQCPEVLSAAVALRPGPAGSQQLVGYMVSREGTDLDEEQTKARLRQRLPAYMVPALLECIAELPVLSCGKVDRNRLPPPRPRQAQPKGAEAVPQSRHEKKLAAVWQRLFQSEAVSLDADFFLDLGGHSLLAAGMVSQLRKDPDFHDLSVPDVYRLPTLRALAAEFAARRPAAAARNGSENGRRKAPRRHVTVPRGRYRWCVAAQMVGLYFIVGFFALQWLAPYLAYCWMAEHGYSIPASVVGSLGVLLGLYPLMLTASIAVKWLVLGRVRPGNYPLWGFYFFRWWFVNRILATVPIDDLAGTPLLNIYYRLLGARIGSNVHFGTDAVGVFDLLSIGDDTSVGAEAGLLGYTIEDGLLKLGPIHIGNRCFIGARSMIGRNARMEDDSSLGELSLLPEGGHIPRGEMWIGSPARALTPAEAALARPAATHCRGSLLLRRWYGVLHALGVFVLPVAYLAAILPGMMLMNYMGRVYDDYSFLLATPLVSVSFVVLLCLEIVLVKWLLLGRIKPGRYRLQSTFYLRKWFVDQLLDMSLDLLGPLYATLYLNPWYRALGAKLGKRAEVSTATSASPDMLTLDDESFVADSVSLGVARVDRGTITVAPTRIGKRAFVGNSALVPAGSTIGDNALLGVLSLMPAGEISADTAWLGSPAIFLPQRQQSTTFSEETTFKPTRKLYVQRALIELLRITLPTTCFVVLSSLLISTVIPLRDVVSLPAVILLFPLLYFGYGVGASLAAVATKWIVMGRYKPAEKPLWSRFVWWTELVTAMREHLADPFLVEMLLGTPLVCWFFRLLGTKIGARVYMDTTDLTEFDLVHIGDDAALNVACTLQTHLFEDRVMKMSTIEIGSRCSVGAGSVVLYDAVLENDCALGDLSLVMKGETLPASTRWAGTPARGVTPFAPPQPLALHAAAPAKVAPVAAVADG